MIRPDSIGERSRGALWVVPSICALAALTLGAALSFVEVDRDSPLAFQGDASDARTILIGVSGTMITVIALLLGLTVVALQLSTTAYSPRVLRNYLRDRPNQIVLGAFVGTFAYSAGGLFTIGVERETFPRFAVTLAIVLMFVSLGLLVYFADHLVHSIQVDNVMAVAERNAMPAMRARDFVVEEPTPEPPQWAVAVPATASGYLQRVDAHRLAADLAPVGLAVQLRHRVGEHVVSGTAFAWCWPRSGDAAVDPVVVRGILDRSCRIGYERTLEQDTSLGLRQLIDMACKALSPAVNDPYTAIQAIERLSVLYAALTVRPVGDWVVGDTVVVPGRRYADHLALGFGLIRRYGAAEPTVVHSALRMLATCAELTTDPAKRAAIAREADLLLDAAERRTLEAADLDLVRRQAELVRRATTP